MAGLWGSKPFSFVGEHYRVERAKLLPKPVQSPRIPIWVAGGWPRRAPFRRAARWDGVCLKSVHAETRQWLTLDDFSACLAYVQAQGPLKPGFDVVMSGEIPEDSIQARETMQAFDEAGATWWLDEGLGWSFDEFRGRIRQGPPQG
jgi:alkanesulfonate monooxygenase SsuD/methylene tetrahydromethanopterin reductase-like flavin-dependent oxidoreductase (luciferase family)